MKHAPDPKYLGAGSRLDDLPSRTLIEVAFKTELEYAPLLFEGLSYADLAHSIMLIEERIIPQDAGCKLLGALVDMHDGGWETLPIDARWGDLYNNRDAELQRRIGVNAGWLHAGRARREALTIAWLIHLRSSCNALLHESINLVSAVTKLSRAHVMTVMPDFTYLQHAQPTTLGHYLLGFAFPIVRDMERLLRTLSDINSSPAGAASTNGSRLPLNRERMRELLGFEQLITHDRDAMWQTDLPIHLMATIVSLCTTLDRLAEDLQIWATLEFDYIELADEHCRSSVIMPNKKNPYALAFIRGKARELDGNLVSVVTTNQTPSGQLDNRNTSYDLLPRAIAVTQGMVKLMEEVLSKADFNEKNMRHQSTTGFTYATELTDLLMEKEGIDSRTCHEIVGQIVRTLSDISMPEKKLVDVLTRIFKTTVGRDMQSDLSEIVSGLSVDHIILNSRGIGSCTPESVNTMCEQLDQSCRQILFARNNSMESASFPTILRHAVSDKLGKKW